MDPGTAIRRAREQAGMTQRELARRSGTSAAAVCLYERGDRVPRSDTLARLVGATGATLTLGVQRPGTVDLVANGRALEEVLDLGEHLPKHHASELAMPPFGSLARR